jgi:hypothetical protein
VDDANDSNCDTWHHHDDSLQEVGPHDCLHTSLQT